MKSPRALLPIIILLSLMFVVSGGMVRASADGLADGTRHDRIQSVFDQYKERASSLGEELPFEELHSGKCGFITGLQLRSLRDRYGKVAGVDEVLDRPSTQEFPETFDSPAGYYKIHYTTESGNNDAVDESYGDENLNGVPDYVEIVAEIADSVWDHHVNELGYREPVNDAQFGGDDDRYDIYIMDLSPSLYGITWTDQFVTTGSDIRATSWMELDNHYENYQGYNDRPLDALRVTMAHEFFHAIHLAYDAQEYCPDPQCDRFTVHWFEMSATWMEEETYDDINDYYFYLPSYVASVHRSPEYFSSSDSEVYGACLLPIFLASRFGPDIIREIWENCGEVTYENFFDRAVQDAITTVSNGTETFESVWAEYTQWLFFMGQRARPGVGFEEAAEYPQIPDVSGSPARAYVRTYTDYPITAQESRDNGFLPSDMGINYLVFRTASLDSTFGMQFQGVVSSNPTTEWRLSVLGFDRFTPTSPVWDSGVLYRNLDAINITNLAGLTDLLVIPTIVNPELNRITNSYQFIVADSSIAIETDDVTYGPSKFRLSEAGATPFRVFLRLQSTESVEIAFFNVAGEMVYSKSYEILAGEQRALEWNGRNDAGDEVASGVYVLQIRIGDHVEHHKILVL